MLIEHVFRSDRDKALDEALDVLTDMQSKWDGAMWAGVRALLSEAHDRIDALREA